MKRSDIPFFVVLALIFLAGTIYAFAHDGGLRWRAADGGFSFETLGVLAATGLTLALYSFLYGDNPFFKAAEHIYVGVGLGYSIVVAWFEYIKPEAYKQLLRYAVREGVPGSPDWTLLPALFLSALMLARFFPRLAFLSRIPVAFIVGYTAATQIPNTIQANVLKQVEDSIVKLSLYAPGGGGELAVGALIGQLLLIAGVVTVLLYFFFSVEHRGAVGAGSRLGVWFLMVAFGASFGYTVMGRMALLVKRLHFLIGDWLRIPLQ